MVRVDDESEDGWIDEWTWNWKNPLIGYDGIGDNESEAKQTRGLARLGFSSNVYDHDHDLDIMTTR